MTDSINCSVCLHDLVTENAEKDKEYEEEFNINNFIEIKRSRYGFLVEDNQIYPDKDDENVKMSRVLCEDCFTKILNESPTLGKLFYSKEKDCFLY